LSEVVVVLVAATRLRNERPTDCDCGYKRQGHTHIPDNGLMAAYGRDIAVGTNTSYPVNKQAEAALVRRYLGTSCL